MPATAAADTAALTARFNRVDRAALERRVAAIERAGLGIGWTDGDVGHGPAYRFTDPDGHVFEVYYETERYRPADDEQPLMRNQQQLHRGRGVGIHRLEHVNFFASDVRPCREFLERELGYTRANTAASA